MFLLRSITSICCVTDCIALIFLSRVDLISSIEAVHSPTMLRPLSILVCVTVFLSVYNMTTTQICQLCQIETNNKLCFGIQTG